MKQQVVERKYKHKFIFTIIPECAKCGRPMPDCQDNVFKQKDIPIAVKLLRKDSPLCQGCGQTKEPVEVSDEG